MDTWGLVVFVYWPGIVLGSALLSMLIHWTFSWSELIFDYVVGILLGVFFARAFESDPSGWDTFFLVFSHGVPGIIQWQSPDTFGSKETFFWWAGFGSMGAVVVCAALDWASHALGPHHWGSVLLSVVQFVLKASFSLFTTAVGALLWIAGLIGAAATSGKDNDEDKVRIGFGGGMLFVEWSQKSPSPGATTLGATINVWVGKLADEDAFRHELYHSRQYIYLRDWMIPAWVVGGLWGLISGAAAGKASLVCFATAHRSQDIGNPMEVAGYRISGPEHCGY